MRSAILSNDWPGLIHLSLFWWAPKVFMCCLGRLLLASLLLSSSLESSDQSPRSPPEMDDYAVAVEAWKSVCWAFFGESLTAASRDRNDAILHAREISHLVAPVARSAATRLLLMPLPLPRLDCGWSIRECVDEIGQSKTPFASVSSQVPRLTMYISASVSS